MFAVGIEKSGNMVIEIGRGNWFDLSWRKQLLLDVYHLSSDRDLQFSFSMNVHFPCLSACRAPTFARTRHLVLRFTNASDSQRKYFRIHDRRTHNSVRSCSPHAQRDYYQLHSRLPTSTGPANQTSSNVQFSLCWRVTRNSETSLLRTFAENSNINQNNRYTTNPLARNSTNGD